MIANERLQTEYLCDLGVAVENSIHHLEALATMPRWKDAVIGQQKTRRSGPFIF